MPKPHPKKQKTIIANSIVLKDAKGQPRIVMNAGDGEKDVYICLYANDGKGIQISTQPEGAISIMVMGKDCRSRIAIGLSADERGSIHISESKGGKLGTILGEEPGTSTHRLLLFKNGQHFWQTPSGRKRKSA